MTNALPVWYLMRASGVVALLLLTLSLCLGIATSNRWRPRGAALYVTTTIHRNASLLAVVFLAVHILTAVIDSDAAVSLASALLPIGPGVWLALGALAFDLVAAILVTSLIRTRLPYRLWRAIHWAAYASWPFAIWHGIGIGSDAATWWLRSVTILCVAWFAGIVVWRLSRHDNSLQPRVSAWPWSARSSTSPKATFPSSSGSTIWSSATATRRRQART